MMTTPTPAKRKAFFASLVNQLQNRVRLIGRDEALELSKVEDALAALDALGPSEIGDIVHSLLWRTTLLEDRASRYEIQLNLLEASIAKHTLPVKNLKQV